VTILPAATTQCFPKVPPYSICAGCPAKVIKSYDFETNEWEKVEKSAINNYK
jgi:acetyltransferase-like isoleucine patch superfamily enzyme